MIRKDDTDSLISLIKKYSKWVDFIELRYENIKRTYFKKDFHSDCFLFLNDFKNDSTSGFFIRVISIGYEIYDSIHIDINDKNYIDLVDKKILFLIKNLKLNGKPTNINIKLFQNNQDSILYPTKNLLDTHSILLIVNKFLDKLWNISPKNINIEASFINKSVIFLYINSFNSNIYQKWDELYAGITCIIQINNQLFSIPIYDGSVGNYSFLNTLFSELTIEKIKQKISLYNALQISSNYNCSILILSSSVSELFLHEVIGHFLEADNQIRYTNIPVLGKQIATPNLTVIDRGLHKYSRGYRIYDSEGILCQDTILIQNGILTSRMHSVQTSSYFNEAPTGNGIAISYKHPPICRQRVISIKSGISEYKKNSSALYLDIPYGGKIDIKNGSFTIQSLEAFVIKNGQPISLVKNFSYSDNILRVLKNIIHIGKNINFEEYSIGCGKNGQRYLRVSSFAPKIVISII